MDDLLEFGEVQRGLLGVQIRDAEGRYTDELSGVYVSRVTLGGAADQAGIESEDVIIGIDDRTVRTTSELQEFVARKRPAMRSKFVSKGMETESEVHKLMKKEDM